ncbi:hypothetical protein [Altererythrobacter sp. MF3-039]|uniref:hypothetical protein n=1 Tax=Altererythrobacter sp. MF3-039 TaxID=3252901 RepID=UPI00390C8268
MSEPDLSDFELLTLMARFEEVGLIASGLLLTVISGFLVMAYTIGDTLTRRQLWLVVPVFIIFAMLGMYAAIGYGALSDYYNPVNYNAPDREPFAMINSQRPFATPNIGMAIGVIVIVGCLLFLRDVRRTAGRALQGTQADAPQEKVVPQVVEEEADAEDTVDAVDVREADAAVEGTPEEEPKR